MLVVARIGLGAEIGSAHSGGESPCGKASGKPWPAVVSSAQNVRGLGWSPESSSAEHITPLLWIVDVSASQCSLFFPACLPAFGPLAV